MIKKLYLKNKEVINYLIVGFLTTCVSIVSYFIFRKVFHIYYIVSNILSWITAITFAYFANRKYVFNSNKEDKLKEFIEFVKYRILSLLIETALMYIMVDIFKLNDGLVKIIVQVIVIILNYIFSKFIVFKRE